MVKNVLIVQRVITSYRLELLKELCAYYETVGIVTSQGNIMGTLKKANTEIAAITKNLKIHELNALRINYTGESRSTTLFIYPQIISLIFKYDTIILEGTTNIFNNMYIIPIARILGKKIIWWDSGYSESVRTKKRKVIDFFIKPFVKLTHVQIAYSSKGKRYIEKYMGGHNTHLNLNTINTNYFETINEEILSSIDNYTFNDKEVQLLYVGVVEERKKVESLVKDVLKLNELKKGRKYILNVVGGGNQLNELKGRYRSSFVNFHGPIYDKEELKSFYFKSDLFVLPGDGGLGILQSLLFGLPVLCLNGADGTEYDYILDSNYLLNEYSEIPVFLESIKSIDKSIYKNYLEKISSKKWINKLVEIIN
jgi:glycosyltransferase involved in cell wall biosynthesis